MPAPLNLLEKFVTMTLNAVPSPMLDLMGGFSFYAVSAAVRLNLFEELKDHGMSAEELAGRVHCDERGLAMLLDVLESLGYLKKRNGRYENSRIARKWMLDTSGVNYARGFAYYHGTMSDIFPHIDKSLAKGAPHINFYRWLGRNRDVVDDFQTFMMSLGRMAVPDIVKNIRLDDDSVLDVGGSHGLYSIALCNRYENSRVSIIDSKYAMPLLKKNINAAGLKNRIRMITGDFLEHSFRERWDVVLLFNMLHEHTGDYCRDIIKKATAILADGGRLIILEGLLDKQPTNVMNLVNRLYNLLFYHFLGGQCYTFNDIRGWLSSAGYGSIVRKRLTASGFTLITGHKK